MRIIRQGDVEVNPFIENLHQIMRKISMINNIKPTRIPVKRD